MKVSVLLGVAQMTLGVCLSLCNHVYFRDHLSAVAEFAPRLVLLLALFGYMDFMILYKWCVDWSAPGQTTGNTDSITCRRARHNSKDFAGWL